MAVPSGWSSQRKNKYSSVFHDLNNRSIFGTDSSHTQLSSSFKGMFCLTRRENYGYQSLLPVFNRFGKRINTFHRDLCKGFKKITRRRTSCKSWLVLRCESNNEICVFLENNCFLNLFFQMCNTLYSHQLSNRWFGLIYWHQLLWNWNEIHVSICLRFRWIISLHFCGKILLRSVVATDLHLDRIQIIFSFLTRIKEIHWGFNLNFQMYNLFAFYVHAKYCLPFACGK